MSAAITINRAPVSTPWAAVAAERLGFDWDEVLTLGRGVARLDARSKRTPRGVRGWGVAETPLDLDRVVALAAARVRGAV